MLLWIRALSLMGPGVQTFQFRKKIGLWEKIGEQLKLKNRNLKTRHGRPRHVADALVPAAFRPFVLSWDLFILAI